jgi:hypothetical protein
MLFWRTKNDGMMLRSESSTLALGWVRNSAALLMSIGDAELAAERSVRRVPVTSSRFGLGGVQVNI